MTWQPLAARVRRAQRDDSGTSLMELVVGMTLMVVFMTMFTTAIVIMTSGTNKVEATTSTTAQVQAAYLRLDRTVRYASALSTPGRSAGGAWYQEFSLPGNDGVATCYQLRVDPTAQQLQQRSWGVNAAGVAAAASGWTPIASSVVNGSAAAGSATVPFRLVSLAASQNQQLRLFLTVTMTSPAKATTSSDVMFTAINSTSTSSTSICQQNGRP